MTNRFVPADDAIRQEAVDVRGSFIVQAPAGSGKTELLTQRFLTLLAIVDEPEEVLAITFSRKAAGEMRDRVLQAIQDAERAGTATSIEVLKPHKRETIRLGRAVLDRSNERGWNLLSMPGRLRIQTIDSLCAALVQQMPMRAQFGAATSVAEDEGQRQRLCQQAAVNAIKSLLESNDAQKNGAITCVLKHLDNNVSGVSGLMAEMLQRRDQWERHVAGQSGTALRAQFESVLRRIVEDGLRAVSESVPEEHRQELLILMKTAAKNLAAEGRDNPVAVLRGAASLPGTKVEDLEKWRAVRWFLLKKDGDWRAKLTVANGFPPGAREDKQRCERLLSIFATPEFAGFREALLALEALPSAAFADSQWDVLDALLTVLPTAVEELRKLFRENTATDFIEVSQGALKAVESGANVRGLKHLLVDEFQDTSVMQWRLLSALVADWKPGDGRTIFLVGDPMQSIYRFRQAEVGLFIQAKEKGIAKLKPKALALTVNFRSDAKLIAWFNRHFQSIFGERDDAAEGRVSFSASDAAPGRPAGVVPECHWIEDAEHEAEHLLGLVQEALKGEGEVAILVRARSHLVEIVDTLRKSKIKFEAVDIQALGERAAIQDLLMLTRALLHPADRLAWIAVLRAPWCGLTLSDLFALCGHDASATIWELLNSELTSLTADGQKRAARVREIMADSLQQRRRKPLREWVEGAWIALGGPACLTDEADLENAGLYFDLLAKLDVARDLPLLDDLEAQVGRLFARPETGDDVRVKIMTIHKAKGLEFETVIVPGLGRAAQHDKSRLLLWEERAAEESDSELLLAPITQKGADTKDPIYQYLQRAEKVRKRHEDKRLLYVAVTRARNRLHLLAAPALNQDGGLKENDSLLSYLWPTASGEFVRVAKGEGGEVPAIAASDEGRPPLRRLPSDRTLDDSPEALRWKQSAPVQQAGDVEPITYDWVGEKLRHIGTVVHSMAQRIARDGLDRWSASRLKASAPIFRAALAERGLGEGDLDEAAAHVQQALLAMISDEQGRWVLGSHMDAQEEFALSGLVDGGEVKNFKIDRTFIDEDGVRWIIDYKTARHEGAGLEGFLANEQVRYERQMNDYARMVAKFDPAHKIRVALYFPLLKQLRSWDPNDTENRN